MQRTRYGAGTCRVAARERGDTGVTIIAIPCSIQSLAAGPLNRTSRPTLFSPITRSRLASGTLSYSNRLPACANSLGKVEVPPIAEHSAPRSVRSKTANNGCEQSQQNRQAFGCSPEFLTQTLAPPTRAVPREALLVRPPTPTEIFAEWKVSDRRRDDSIPEPLGQLSQRPPAGAVRRGDQLEVEGL
jgi:hypothetical protein